MELSGLDVFVVISGTFSILATFPLLYLAIRGYRDGHRLRLLQVEVAELMVEVHGLQGEIQREQQTALSGIRETKQTVERVAELTENRRRRLPRLRVQLVR